MLSYFLGSEIAASSDCRMKLKGDTLAGESVMALDVLKVRADASLPIKVV